MKPRVVIASENIELAGLMLVALSRLRAAGELELAAVWSNCDEQRSTPLPMPAHKALINATTVHPPSPPGTGSIIGGVPIVDFAQLCAELDVPYHCVPDVNARHVAAAVTSLRTDLGVICGHSQFFRRAIRRAPRLGWVNMHPSLLPRHRGPYPGFWEFRNGDPESGVTLHRTTGNFDAGEVLAQATFPITPGMRFADLVAQQARLAAGPMVAAIQRVLAGEEEPIEQDPEIASYESAPSGEDFVLDSAMTCGAMAQFVDGMKEVAPVLVRIEGELLVVEAVRGWQEDPSKQSAAGDPVLVDRETVRMPAWDGEAVLQVRDVTAADFGQQVASN